MYGGVNISLHDVTVVASCFMYGSVNITLHDVTVVAKHRALCMAVLTSAFTMLLW